MFMQGLQTYLMKQGAENVKSIQRKRSRPLCQWHSSCKHWLDPSQASTGGLQVDNLPQLQKCNIKEANVIEEFRFTTKSTEPVIICRMVGVKSVWNYKLCQSWTALHTSPISQMSALLGLTHALEALRSCRMDRTTKDALAGQIWRTCSFDPFVWQSDCQGEPCPNCLFK